MQRRSVQPWATAWQDALYGPSGFYRDPVGPAGHFATSSHGPRGAVFAEAVLALADRYACRHVVDVGAGRGELLTLMARQDTTARYGLTGVDIVPRPAGLPESISWMQGAGGAALPPWDFPGRTLILANEWLDVIPCPIGEVDRRGVLREVCVSTAGVERLGEVAGESADFGPQEREWVERWWPLTGMPGERVEVGLPRDVALANLVARTGSGVVAAVDYGHWRDGRPLRGSLNGYRGGRAVTPVPDGSCDLTAHVAMDSLGADTLLSQRDLVADLLAAPTPTHEMAHTDPSRYVVALQRFSALCELRGPMLGGFWWALTHVGRDEPRPHPEGATSNVSNPHNTNVGRRTAASSVRPGFSKSTAVAISSGWDNRSPPSLIWTRSLNGSSRGRAGWTSLREVGTIAV